MVEGSQTARLSHLPLAPLAPATLPLVSIQARYAKPRRGQIAYPTAGRSAVGVFAARCMDDRSIRRPWILWRDTGELIFPLNIMGLPYNEVR